MEEYPVEEITLGGPEYKICNLEDKGDEWYEEYFSKYDYSYPTKTQGFNALWTLKFSEKELVLPLEIIIYDGESESEYMTSAEIHHETQEVINAKSI